MEDKISSLSKNIDRLNKEILNITKIIQELKPEKNINKKRKVNDDKRNEIIQKLINGKKKSQSWKPGMSKYITITYIGSNKKWIFQSTIFNISELFQTKEDAESYYEKILDKYDISYEYITRNEYVSGINSEYKDAIDGLILISK